MNIGWIGLVEEREKWLTVVRTVMNILVQYHVGNLRTIRETNKVQQTALVQMFA